MPIRPHSPQPVQHSVVAVTGPIVGTLTIQLAITIVFCSGYLPSFVHHPVGYFHARKKYCNSAFGVCTNWTIYDIFLSAAPLQWALQSSVVWAGGRLNLVQL